MTPEQRRAFALELAVKMSDAWTDTVAVAEAFDKFLAGPETSEANPPVWMDPPAQPFPRYVAVLSPGGTGSVHDTVGERYAGFSGYSLDKAQKAADDFNHGTRNPSLYHWTTREAFLAR
jgi:hypothetical protein